jgi:hypothetical protein
MTEWEGLKGRTKRKDYSRDFDRSDHPANTKTQPAAPAPPELLRATRKRFARRVQRLARLRVVREHIAQHCAKALHHQE